MAAQTDLKLIRSGADVICDNELFEHLLDMAEILAMSSTGTKYAPGTLKRIGRQLRQLRQRYDAAVVEYYADSWDPDETEPDDIPNSN